MTLNDYIEALIDTGLFRKNKAQLVVSLFKDSGTHVQVTESSARKWLHGDRNCDIVKYFPDEEMNTKEFIKSLKSRTKQPDSWRIIQKAFININARNDKNSCVDTETQDPDVFLWSLLNQFQRIFKLPESDYPDTELVNGDIKKTIAVTNKNGVTLQQLRDCFMDGVKTYGIMDIVNRKPPIVNMVDGIEMKSFFSKIREEMMSCEQNKNDLYRYIDRFAYKVDMQGITIITTINVNFRGDESASFNIETFENIPSIPKRLIKYLPKIDDLINIADNPYELYKLKCEKPWPIFRAEMNLLFKEIKSWKF